MVYCTVCGKEVRNGKFCPNCGSKINKKDNSSIESQNTKYCTNCGIEIDSNAKVCPKCGAKQNLQNIGNSNNPNKEESSLKNEIKGNSSSASSKSSSSLKNNKFIALILSFIIPGLGFFYLRLPKRAILILLIAFIGVFLWSIPTVLIWIYGMYSSYKSAVDLSEGRDIEDKFF